MTEVREWLIRKDGYYYRPDKHGYTTSKFEAGRYTEADARKEAEIEPWHMKALHQDEVPNDLASASVAHKAAELEEARNDVLSTEAELSIVRKDRDRRYALLKAAIALLEKSLFDFSPVSGQNHRRDVAAFLRVNTPPDVARTAPGSHRLVIVESPYAGEVEANVAYARAALADCLARGEAPFASHLLYTQDGILDDTDPAQRARGILAGLAWGSVAAATVVYTDRGISNGMHVGISRAIAEGRAVEYRTLEGLK